MTSALDPLNGLFSVDNFPFGDNTWTVVQLVVREGEWERRDVDTNN